MRKRDPEYSYDSACKELAHHFLGFVRDGGPDSCTARELFDLSQAIQDAVESWFASREAERTASDENMVTMP